MDFRFGPKTKKGMCCKYPRSPKPNDSEHHLILHPNKAQPPDSSMAAAISSIANLFSFFAPSPPSPPPKCPPSRLSLSSSSAADASSSKDRWDVPLISSNDVHVSLSCSSDSMSVVCPSLAYANTLFFGSPYNVQVIVDDEEPEEKVLTQFKREVMRAGIIQECNRRRFFENSQDEKKRKSREAARRNRRRRLQLRATAQESQEATKKKKSDEDEDNWDLPEGDLPY